MDVVTLIDTARKAGLQVRTDGVTLTIEGPQRLRPLAEQLGKRKPEVIAALEAEAGVVDQFQTPRSRLFLDAPERYFAGWRRSGGAWVAPWSLN